ncbi:MAG: winged helix-turn-helix transcriptional regulator [Candidatus Methanoperedens sp.]
MKIVNKSYFCEIILALKNKPKYFNDILRDVKTSPSSLNRRIKELAKYGLIEPIIERINDENRIKYRLTKKGDVLIGDIDEFVRLYEKLDESIVQKQREIML